mmetsp:Transcript_34/g.95  ORF Transcript_34/g.95 Transcript_34/m.95 type:complete len:336 (-) Transcript_34:125-1132(-)
MLPPIGDHRAQRARVVRGAHVWRVCANIPCTVQPDHGAEPQAFEWVDHVREECRLHVGRCLRWWFPRLRALGHCGRARPDSYARRAPGAAHKAHGHTTQDVQGEQRLAHEPSGCREATDVGAGGPCPAQGLTTTIGVVVAATSHGIAPVHMLDRPERRRTRQALRQVVEFPGKEAVMVRLAAMRRHDHDPDASVVADLVCKGLLPLLVGCAELVHVAHWQVDVRLAREEVHVAQDHIVETLQRRLGPLPDEVQPHGHPCGRGRGHTQGRPPVAKPGGDGPAPPHQMPTASIEQRHLQPFAFGCAETPDLDWPLPLQNHTTLEDVAEARQPNHTRG